MGTHLHQSLRNLCLDSVWKYAVFWKLKHQARMMLTWEDAYYENHDKHDPPENMCFAEIGGNLSDWHSHDPLGLAVAQMSYHVYSLGEGVIGQVAVTGKHMWIFADKHVTDSYLPFGHYDGWQTQFSAGIKTVVLVAVVPLGVVQLGSLTRIPEDLKLVNRIRDGFFALSVGFTSSATHCTVRSSSSLSDVSTRSSVSGNPYDCISNSGRPVIKDKIIIRSPTVSSTENPADCSYVLPLPGDLAKNTVEVISKEGGLDFSTSRVANSLQSRCDTFLSGQQNQILTRLHIDRKCGGEISCFGFGYLGVGSEDHHALSSDNSFGKVNLGNITFPADDFRVDLTSFPSDHLNSAACNYNDGISCTPEPFVMQIPNELGNMNFQTEINNTEALNAPLKFSAGCELYEVLGPAFRKHGSFCEWEAERTLNERDNTEMREGKDNSSLLTADSGSEHLLEAVVANVCRSGTDFESEKSFSKPLKSVLTTEKKPQPPNDKVTVGSAGYSFDQSLVEKDTLHSLNSEASGVSSSKGVSSRSLSTFSEQLDSMQERGKMNKKRARPGETGRPRPRDRQLIQDRIKELRELVPNGGKCSIDSLLERTIKHMLFMQSVTKHADKLNKCTDSKLRDKETVARGLPNYDQGSSWAMEVESHLKVCPIIIENINMNGQLLIEMLCEECSHFLEIAKVIRSLGLTILKGVTEARDKKIWMCFVVEGQNDRSLHRMDILWSLVQILQSKEI